MKFKLLVVDDEPDVNTIFELMFEDLIENDIFEYHYFRGGEECMDFLSDQDKVETIFLILSDINMPNMDGFSLLEEIKKVHEELTVYMISAYCDDSYIERAKKLGADDYIVKPVDFQSLRDKLLAQLDKIKQELS